MNELKQVLKKLKNYGICGIRTDMASEVVSEEEFVTFKQFCTDFDLKYNIKIGGCDALTDIYAAKNGGADTIICPMIETDYALQKFVDNCKQVYEDLNKINLLINIETICAYNNLDSILASKFMKFINGIVLGRDDMTKSLSLDIAEINSDKIFDIAVNISNKVNKYGKSFTVGGGIRPQAVEFLKRFNCKNFKNYETRRIVFDANMIHSMDKTNCRESIAKAIEFEINWLEYTLSKQHTNKTHIQNRIEFLKNCLFV